VTTTQLETYRQQLLALRGRLDGHVSHLAGEALHKDGEATGGNLSHLPLHMADLGSDSADQDMTLGLLENQGQTLAEIVAALERASRGTFGCCEECGHDIAPGRLHALPYTRHCVACARQLQGEAPPA
jgi:RNA polymerase-binding transcription factor DksA